MTESVQSSFIIKCILFQNSSELPEFGCGEVAQEMPLDRVILFGKVLYSYCNFYCRTQVDYLSLDVEGVELEVLQTVPWDKVNITVLSVEFSHGPLGKEVLRHYVESQGYRTVTEVTYPGNLANDFIFMKL